MSPPFFFVFFRLIFPALATLALAVSLPSSFAGLVDPLPTITSADRLLLGPQQPVIIAGTNFIGISSVKFAGVEAVSFSTTSQISILAVAPSSFPASGAITVTNSAGTATSSFNVTFTSPNIGSPLTNATVSAGGRISFTVAPKVWGTGTLSYQWKKDGVSLSAVPGNIAGVTSDTLVLTNVQAANAASAAGYTVVVTDSIGTVTSTAATLRVSAPPLAWNPATEFSVTKGNPNGVWSYGSMDTGFVTFTPYVNTGGNSSGYASWYGSGGDQTPTVALNGQTTPFNGVPAGYVLLHPSNGNEPSVLRWTAPLTAAVRVTGQFHAGDGGAMQVAVRHNNSVRFSSTDAGVFDLTLNVVSGDRLDFAVFGGFTFGSTGLQLNVAAVTTALPLTTADSNKLSLGTFAGGTQVRIDVTGTGDLVDSRLQVFPDGSLAGPAGAPWVYANSGAAYPGIGGFPAGDGLNHYPGGGLNYDANSGTWLFAGKLTSDTTDPATIRAGAVVGTFVSSPVRSDWFAIGFGGTFTVPAGGATLYLAVNEAAVPTANSDNHGSYAISYSSNISPVVSVPLTTLDTNKLSLGTFGPGAVLHISVTGSGNLAATGWSTKPDGSLASAATGPFTFANVGTAYPNVASTPSGDGLNRFPGGGANYDYNGSGFPFAGKLTTDTSDVAAIRFGALVGTYATAPTRNDWFLIGNGGAFTVPPGTGTLSVAVNETSVSDNNGSYNVVVAFSPANDNFAARSTILNSSATVIGNNSGGTKEVGETNHATNPGGASSWWTWTAPKTGVVTVSTVGSSFDTLLAVYTGTAVGSLTLIASDDNSGPSNTSQLTFNATAGTAYQIAVDGKNSGSGAATGNITVHLGYAYYFSTFAGLAGNAGSTNATGRAARFSGPNDVVVDSSGNLYVGENVSHTIRKITPAGVVTTLAGSAGLSGTANGTGTDARFKQPLGLALDGGGNILVADYENHSIRKVTPAGVVTTVAGLVGTSGPDNATGTAARFNFPVGLTVDTAGNIFVADSANHVVRKITAGGVVTTFAGTMGTAGSADGAGTGAKFNNPYRLAFDPSGNLYVSDTFNHTIRKITPAGVVTTLAGAVGVAGGIDGAGNSARFNNPYGLAVDVSGNVFTADYTGHTLRRITPSGVVTTLGGLAGTFGLLDGTGSDARFNQPTGVALDSSGNLFISDFTNQTIRKGVPAFAPEVASVSPGAFAADGTVTITGANFTAATAVAFNGTPAAAFTVVSPTTITATAPATLTAGFVTVAGPGGTSTVTAAFTVGVPAPSANDRFDPNANGPIHATVVQPDGKIIIAGDFTTLQPNLAATATTATRLARLNRDGSVDATFTASADQAVFSLALQADGKILIGGSFTSVNSTTRNRVARLNANGTLDSDFNPNANGGVNAIAVQSDGKILLGGSFSTLQPPGAGSAIARTNFARLLADGTLDSLNLTITVGEYGVRALLPLPDGSILVSGDVSTVNSVSRAYIFRITAGGALDAPLPTTPVGLVSNLARQVDGKILLGGEFTSLGSVTGTSLARLNADLTLDTGFNPAVGFSVKAITTQADGKIVVGGGFTTVAGQTRKGLARFRPDGTLDTGFVADVSNSSGVNTLALQPDGSLVVGGDFTTLATHGRGRIARVLPDGSLERALSADTNGIIEVAVRQPDGKTIIGGTFTTVAGVARTNLARLNADSTLDTGFDDSQPNGTVRAIVVQPDAQIVIGGTFTSLTNLDASRTGLARLTASGGLDSSFNAQLNGSVTALALQSDGKIIVGGGFTQSGATPRNRVARFTSLGALDTFDPNLDSSVTAIAVQADSKVLVGGSFTLVGAVGRNGLARVEAATGAAESGFNPAANGGVNAIVVLPSQQILVGGQFTTIAGNSANYVARLNSVGGFDGSFNATANQPVNTLALAANGKLAVGGTFTSITNIGSTARDFLALLNASDGSPETAFNVYANSDVHTAAWTPDGKLTVAGNFTNIGGQARARLARLASTAPTETKISATASTVTLTRSGPLPEVAWVTFEKSSDGVTGWSALGTAARVGTTANWQLAGQALAGNTLFYLRARAAAPSSIYGSSSLVEHVQQVYFVTVVPAIASISPSVLGIGAPVTIIGTNFTGANEVRFNGITAASFTVDSPTQITAIVPSGVTAGAVTVVSPAGTATSPTNYTTTTAPLIVSIDPMSGTVGRIVTILGGNFGGISNFSTPSVSFNGIATTAQRQAVPGGFRVAVPTGATTGPITVTVSGVPVVSATFTVLTTGTAPANDDFANAQVIVGPTGVIGGTTAFATKQSGEPTLASAGTRSVWFSWVAPSSGAFLFDQSGSEFGAYLGVYTGSALNALTLRATGDQPNTFAHNYSPAALVATAGTTYFIAVDGFQGTSGQFKLAWAPLAAPTIASFTPTSAYAGSAMTITGTNFTRGMTVTIGGVSINTIPSSASTLVVGALPSVPVSGPVVVTTVAGTVMSGSTFTVPAQPSGGGRALINLSALTTVGTGANAAHSNFSIEGSTAKIVLVRVVGPKLASFGVTGFLADPKLELFNGQGQSVAQNDDWDGSTAMVNATAAAGAFTLISGSKDAAALVTLSPGTYTVRAEGVGATSGQALVEIYDTETSLRIPYMALRQQVNVGANVIAGFFFTGPAQRLLIRAVGPALSARGLSGALANPTLSVFSGNQVIASNDNWGTASANPTLAAAATTAGLFPLADGSNDAALLVDLVAGSYTVQVSGVSSTSGITQIEVAQVDTARAASFAPALLVPPQSATIVLGGSATFAAPALGRPAPTYQWFRAGVPLSSATNAVLPFTNLQSSDAANYSVALTNSAGTTTSAAYVLGAPVVTTSAAVVASVAPPIATFGAVVTMTGTGFTGATVVAFNGASSAFSVVSDSIITAFVPAGATSGAVTVTKPAPAGISGAGVSLVVNPPTNSQAAELVTRVPASMAGVTAPQSMSAATAISGDGRYVAFASDSHDLVAGLVNPYNHRQVYRWDRTTGLVILVSRVAGLATTVGDGYAEGPLMSNDGRYIAYVSSSSNHVVSQSGTAGNNVFLFDAQTGVTTLVTHAPGLPAATMVDDGFPAGLSDDGRYVFFGSASTSILAGMSNPGRVANVFRWDRQTDTVILISHLEGSAATAANGDSYHPLALSRDGRFVAFGSRATNLVAGQTDINGAYDVFLRDCQTDSITLITRAVASATTASSNGGSLYNPGRLSDEGRYVAFYSGSSDVVSGFTYRSTDNLYLHDTTTGLSTLVTRGVGANATVALGGASGFALSADGRYVVYKSTAPDVVTGQIDTNGLNDLFVFDRVSTASTLISRAAGTVATTPTYGISQPDGYPLPLTRNARYAAFSTVSSNLVTGVTPTPGNDEDVYVADLQTGVIVLASRKIGGGLNEAGGNATAKLMAADAPVVLFSSSSTQLVAANNLPNTEQLYVFEADLLPPSVAISAPSASATLGTSVTYTVTYTDAAAITLSPDQIALNSTGTAGALVLVTGSGLTTRTVTLSAFTGSGTVGISILPGSASDLSNNPAPGVGPSGTVSVSTVSPVIGTPPAPFVTAQVGGSFNLTVVATSPNAGTLSYQWRKFGQPVAGATGATFTPTALTLFETGLYDVQVFNNGSPGVSSATRVVVNAPLPSATVLTGSSNFAPRVESDFVYFDRVVRTAEGKVYVSGNFTSLFGALRPGFARLNADGTLDSSFVPAPVSHDNSASVNCVAVQADGRVLIGGTFEAVGGVERDCLARLNPDGTVDQSFVPPAGLAHLDEVNAILVQPDGKILVAGSFNDSGVNIARLNPDGSRDTTFVQGAGFSGRVYALALQAGGEIVVGGNFSQYQGVTVGRIARLSSTGVLDTAYKTAGGSGFNSVVSTLVLQPDGKLLVGGDFTAYGGSPRRRLARLLDTGALDVAFDMGVSGSESTPGFDNSVAQIALQPDGAIVVVGDFLSFTGISTHGIVRLTSSGSRDTSFVTSSDLDASPGFNDGADGVALLTTGLLVISNDSDRYASPVANTGPLTRLTALGALDTSYAPVPRSAGTVYALVPAPGGKWFVGGSFSRVNGIARGNLARLNADGTLDSDFVPTGTGFSSAVEALAVRPDGRVLVGGRFTQFNGTSGINRLIQLTSAGAVDTSFIVGSGFNGGVYALALQAGGKVIVGGGFNSYNGVARSRLVRLTPTGAVDGTFVQTGTGFNSDVRALAVLNDGRLYVGGAFTDYGAALRYRLARLHADGTLDSSYDIGETRRINNTVKALVVQPDGKLLVGGDFYSVYDFYTSGLVRFNDDGSRDTTFAAFETNSNFTALHLQSDGRIVVAGDFTRFGYYNYATELPHLARLSATGVLETAFVVPGFASAPTLIQPTATGALLLGGEEFTFPDRTLPGLARLEAAPVPTISTPPATQMAAVGASATFNVVATGANLTYQWLKDGILLPGATGAAFTIPSAQLANVGAYSVRVANIFGTVTSSSAPLTGTGVAPTIIGQPAAISVSAGASATLSIAAAGATNYQWRKLGAPLAGASTATFTIPVANLGDTGLYDVLVGNGLSVTRSAAGRISVTGAGSVQSPLVADRAFPAIFESGGDGYGQPRQLLVQPDGSYYVAGNFSSVDGVFRFGLARFSAAGVIDPAFAPEISEGNINALARQADGKLVIVGDFHRVNSVECNHIARLNANGTLDTTFISGSGSGTFNSLYTVAIQDDQKILIGGNITSFGGASVTRLVRLNSDGTVDTAFRDALLGGLNGTVHSLAVHSDGRIYAVGSFTQFNATSANHLVALNADGTRFPLTGFPVNSFDSESSVRALVIHPDGKMVLAGSFNSFGGVSVGNLVGLNADGSPDPTYRVSADGGANSTVTRLVRQSDGSVYVAGYFSSFDRINGSVVRLSPTGVVDRSFILSGGSPEGLAIGSGDHVLVVGNFDAYYTAGYASFSPRAQFARFDSAGALTASQVIRWGSLQGTVRTMVPAPDGKWLVGGSFSRIGGRLIQNLARLDADGSNDLTFPAAQSPLYGSVLAITVQGDGKILVGGEFTDYGTDNSLVGAGRLLRLNADGTRDATFKIGEGFNATVTTLTLQADGKIIVGGDFTTLDGRTISARLVRLLADGTVDTSFLSGTGLDVTPHAIIVQRDDKIVVGGGFYVYNTASVPGLIRLHQNGVLDPTLASPVGFVGQGVRALVLQANEQLIIGGHFGFHGEEGISRWGIGRFNADGSPDTTFNTGTGFTSFALESSGGTVTSLALQGDGQIIAAGYFSEFNGVDRRGLARLNADGTLDTTFANLGGDLYSEHNSVVLRPDGSLLLAGDALDVNGTHRQGLIAITGAAPAPTINVPPVAQSAVFGGSATFSVTASGRPATTFQWQRNGVDLPGATNTTYTVTAASQANAGLYRVIVSNSGGSVPSVAVPFDVVTRNLINFYASAALPAKGSITSSFTVEGTEPKSVLLIGVGGTRATVTIFSGGGDAQLPAAAPPRSPSVLDPRLRLVNAAGSQIAENNDWSSAGNAAAITLAAAQVGATPGLTATGEGAKDAAMLVTLAPGTYTVTLDGAEAAAGSGLLQIYDADTDGRPRLVMFTLRANVGSGDKTVVAGFTIDGTLQKTVLLRALGDSLGASTGVLQDTYLTFYRGPNFVDSNDDSSISDPVALAAHAQVGVRAFTDTLDSTLLRTLAPGAYTAQIRPLGSESFGTALFELFEVDAQRPATIAPVITYLAANQSVVQNDRAYFGVVAVAKPAPTYQWRKNGTPLSTNVTSHNPVLELPNVQPADADAYDVVITSGANILTSPARTLTLLPEFHASDSNSDRRIGLIELTRIIQFYNYRDGTVRTGEYRTLAGTEDGFTLGPGAITNFHSGDSNRDGRFDIFELTRVIELYNFLDGTSRTGAYHAEAGTEDGFAPGPRVILEGVSGTPPRPATKPRPKS